MRISDSMRFANAAQGQERTSEEVYQTTRRASSGMRVEKPSDDPAAYASVAAKDARLSVLTSRRSALQKSAGDLDTSEGVLAASGDLLVQARTIALDALSGEKSPADRALAAQQLAGIRDTLLGFANTKGAHGYLFAGTATNAPPFTAAGAFVGNAATIGVEIADGVVIASNASGAKAFTAAGGRDVLGDLQALSQALAANNVGAAQPLTDAMDLDHRQVVAARADVGLTSQRVKSADDVTASLFDTVTAARASEAEVDAAGAYSDLFRAKAAYERNVQVTAQILALSASRG
jgi:flagellar hook-associated protein 3 FlgL